MALTAGVVSQGLPASPATGLAGVRLVVFDVGGTIIEDQGDVPALLRAVFSERGIEVTPEQIDQWRGASKRTVVKHFVNNDKLADEIYGDFRRRLDEAYRKVPAIAGAQETFEKLKQRGYLMAVTTGFDHETVGLIFGRLGWEKYFTATICSDDVVEGRPAPYLIFHAMEAARINKVGEVIAVGDTPLDLQAASNAGVRGVGVLSGSGKPEALKKLPHTHILPSVAHLPDLLPGA